MKKLFIFLGACMSMVYAGAQNADSTFIFLQNSSFLKTGILYDKVLHWSNLQFHSGTSDTLSAGPPEWKQMYAENYHSFLSSPLPADPDAVSADARQARLSAGVIPVGIMNYHYNRIDSAAFINGWLIADSAGFIHESSGLTKSPYTEERLFAASVIENGKFQVGAPLAFVFSSQYYYSNDPAGIKSLEIDFGDGLGFHPVMPGQVTQVVYPSAAMVHNDHVLLKLKLVTGQGAETDTFRTAFTLSMEESHCTSLLCPDTIFSLSAIPACLGSVPDKDNQFPAAGRAYVKFGNGNNGHLKKPIIFVEGIDFNTGNSIGNPYRYGDFGWMELTGRDTVSYPQMTQTPQLMDSLLAKGYDFVLVDFADGADYMQRNAMVVVDLLEKINSVKTGKEENIVVGASMGGQVAKYALACMESRGIKHCTREYVSFDSPHRGANIDLGMQQFLNFLSAKAYITPVGDMVNATLNRPAAQQLLLLYYSGTTPANPASQLRTSWLSDLAAVGVYPQQLRKVAMANGSGNGTPQTDADGTVLNAHDQLFDFSYAFQTGQTIIDMKSWAVPSAGSATTFDAKYPKNDLFLLSLDALCLSPNNMLCYLWTASGIPFHHYTRQWETFGNPYDNAPGGVRMVAADIAQNFHDNLYLKILKPFLPGLKIKSLHDNQCFIPTISALDVNTTDLFLDLKAALPSNPSLTAFEDVYSPDKNQSHVTVTTGTGSNGEWISKEIESSRDLLKDTLKSAFNYGRYESRYLGSTVIDSGGKLFVNANMATDYGTGAVPPSGHSFTLSTCFCDPGVIINKGGMLILGESSPDNKAVVRFRSGSKLTINDGGKLIIRDKSVLIIEEGAQLVYNGGAQVELQGDSAVLEIDGGLALGLNADFTFSGNTTGSGFVRLGLPLTHPNFTADVTSSITLKGDSTGDKVLEITGGRWLTNPAGMKHITISKGKIEMGDQAYLNIDCPVTLKNLLVTALPGSANNHGGIILNGQAGHIVKNIIVEKGSTGITDRSFYGGTSLTLSNVTVKNCTTGLLTYDKGAMLNNCDFSNNTAGWQAVGMTLPSFVSGTRLSNNTTGVYYSGSTGSGLYLDQPDISGNGDGIEADGGLTVNIKCGNVKDNLSNGFLMENSASLNLSPNSTGQYGKVDASGNMVTYNGNYAGMWHLAQGYNNLQPFSSGLIASGTMFMAACQNSLVASNNKWNSAGTAPNPGQHSLYAASCTPSNKINILDADPKSPVSCSALVSAGNLNAAVSSPLDFYQNAFKLNTVSFQGVTINAAVKQAMNQRVIGNPNGSEIKAVKMLYEILMFTPTASQASNWRYSWIQSYAYSQMKEALGHAFLTGAASSYSAASTPVHQLLDVQDLLISQASAQNDQNRKFYLTVDKANTYHLVKDLHKTLELLDMAAACFQPDSIQSAYLVNMRRFVFAEYLVLNGMAPKESFEQLLNGGLAAYSSSGGINTECNGEKINDLFFTGDTIMFTPSAFASSCQWNFGDCSTIAGNAVSHVFAAPGRYKVTLSENYPCSTLVKTTVINVYPRPEADFTITAPVCALGKQCYFISTSPGLPAASCTSPGSYSCLDTSGVKMFREWKIDGLSFCASSKDTHSTAFCKSGLHSVQLKSFVQRYDSTSHVWEMLPRADSLMKLLYVDSCPSISGTVAFNESCRGSMAGDSIVLLDASGNVAYSVSPAVISGDGSFSFDPALLPALDPVGLYKIETTSGLMLSDTSALTIQDWIAQSPLSLSVDLYNVKESWIQRFNSPDFAYDAGVVVKTGFSVFAAGVTRKINTGNDYLVIKYNRDGSLVWSQSYGTPGNDMVHAMVIDGNDNVYVTGEAEDPASGRNFVTVKTDSSGQVQWTSVYDGPMHSDDIGLSIALDHNGNVYVSGVSYEQGTVKDVLVKYNNNGNQLWVSSGTDRAGLKVKTDSMNNVYVLAGFGPRGEGYIPSQPVLQPQNRIAVVKYNDAGTELWRKYSDPFASSDFPSDMIVSPSGEVCVTGASGANCITLKYDTYGSLRWKKIYSPAGGMGNSIAQGTNGEIMVAATTAVVPMNYDYTVLSYDSSGSLQWDARYDGPVQKDDILSTIISDSEGNVYVTGTSTVQGPPNPWVPGNRDYATVKYSRSGIQQWIELYEGPGNFFDEAVSLAIDDEGSIYVTGSSQGLQSVTGCATVKYTQCGQDNASAPRLSHTELREKQLPNSRDTGEIYVFPNPASGELNVILNQGIHTVRLSNILGMELLVKTMGASGKIDLSGVRAGLYFVEIFDEMHNRIYIQKLVINDK